VRGDWKMGLVGAVGALALLGAACFGDGPTAGELGRVHLAWDEGALCLLGCDADEPIAARAIGVLKVTNTADLPPFTVESSDESVAAFTLLSDEWRIKVESFVQGRADLVFRELDGALIDRFPLDVRDIHSITPRREDLYEEELTLVVGAELTVHLDLRDKGGQLLKGTGGVDYDLTGGIDEDCLTLGEAIAQMLLSPLFSTVEESVRIDAEELGAGAIEVTSPIGTKLTIPIAVVEPTAVTRVDLSTNILTLEVGDNVTVLAEFWAGDEPLHGAACEWTLDSPDGKVSIDAEGTNSVTVIATAPATASVTCDAGGVSQSRSLTFH